MSSTTKRGDSSRTKDIPGNTIMNSMAAYSSRMLRKEKQRPKKGGRRTGSNRGERYRKK